MCACRWHGGELAETGNDNTRKRSVAFSLVGMLPGCWSVHATGQGRCILMHGDNEHVLFLLVYQHQGQVQGFCPISAEGCGSDDNERDYARCIAACSSSVVDHATRLQQASDSSMRCKEVAAFASSAYSFVVVTSCCCSLAVGRRKVPSLLR